MVSLPTIPDPYCCTAEGRRKSIGCIYHDCKNGRYIASGEMDLSCCFVDGVSHTDGSRYTEDCSTFECRGGHIREVETSTSICSGCTYDGASYHTGELITSECAVMQCAGNKIIPTSLITEHCVRCTKMGWYHRTFDGVTFTTEPRMNVSSVMVASTNPLLSNLSLSVRETSCQSKVTKSVSCYDKVDLTTVSGDKVTILPSTNGIRISYRGLVKTITDEGITLDGIGGIWAVEEGIRILMPQSLLIEVGLHRVIVWAPGTFSEKIVGLCGYFDFVNINDLSPNVEKKAMNKVSDQPFSDTSSNRDKEIRTFVTSWQDDKDPSGIVS